MFDDKEYLVLLRLYACPGEFLHEQYWKLYNLREWHNDYQTYPTLRTTIDRLLHQHLGWEWYEQPSGITAYQRQWIVWMPKLPVMLTSLGLMNLNSADYFLLGDYRRVLINILGEVTVNQLFTLWQGENEAAIVTADELPAIAFSLGLQFFSEIVGDDWVGKMIMCTLPPTERSYDVEQLSQFELDGMSAMLSRIGRFI